MRVGESYHFKFAKQKKRFIINYKGRFMSNLIKIRSFDKSLSIKNLSATQSEIAIYGAIGGYWEDSVSAKSVLDAINGMEKTVNTINLRINSPGGDVFEGISIYNVLKNSSKKVNVYVDGIAASIASIIALAGDKVIMGEGAMFMIHKPLTFAAGNSKDFMEIIDRLDDVEEQLISIYRKNTNLDRTAIKSMMAEETYFDSAQSIDYGFASEKMQDDEYINMAACLKNAYWINNKSDIVKRFDDKKDAIGKEIEKIEATLARK